MELIIIQTLKLIGLSIPLLLLTACLSINKKKVTLDDKPYLRSDSNDIAVQQLHPLNSPITVIADVHGDFPTLQKLLQAGKLIDAQNRWIAGKRILVSVGDLVDRGPDSRQILDFFMELEKQAAKAGGAFYMALGNHEVMNIRGDLRYVSDPEFAAFKNDEPIGLRQSTYQAFIKKSKLTDSDKSRQEFQNQYPEGFFGHIKMYAPDGKYGRWLLSKQMIVNVQDKLFAHGGFSQDLIDSGKSLQELNQQFISDLSRYSQLWRELVNAGLFQFSDSKRERLNIAKRFIAGNLKSSLADDESLKLKTQQFIALADSLLFDSFGPTWYRGNMLCHEYVEENTIDNVLRHFGATQIFLGHTPDSSLTVRSRLNNKVIMLDTGMSSAYYKGNPSLVSINKAELKVLNLNDANNTSPISESARKPLNPHGFNDNEISKIFLRSKPKSSPGQDLSILTFPLKDGTIQAAFREAKPHQVKKELAAYQLDRLLELHLVPFVMEYDYQGKAGILQYLLKNSKTKHEIEIENISLKGYCKPEQSQELMQIFDWLIANTDRSNEDQLYIPANSQLWLINHAGAFRELDSDKSFFSDMPNRVSPLFIKSLNLLNRDNLNKRIGRYISKQQIEHILLRRDLLLQQSAKSK
ncbi:metallophosphoesterase [Kangiella sp. HZ709]|uniref:metallophosphoesterase n=1 Tax=Kangiella sp. HZ709 TaxID=2666328 RepID=UPI001D0D85E7|nr:metallophosphoesterase [Kangiella sp. HZ709]